MEGVRAKSFVTIMIVIALSALLLRVALEKFLTYSIAQNESAAIQALKYISAAMENYARDNKGEYPKDFSTLTHSKPAYYLDKNYIALSPLKGYVYACPKMETTGYICNAQPYKCKLTGNTSYSISTGSLFVSEECAKTE
jgi:type II secretory pathway pseudopilin PulG